MIDTNTIVPSTKIIWLDLETTGLDARADNILEVAVVITDEDLEILHEPLHRVVYWDDSMLDHMGDWSKQQHGKTGLLEECRSVQNHDSCEVEREVFHYIRTYGGDRPMLGGASIHFDRGFIKHHWRELDKLLHYRMIDVSTVKELARRWFPSITYQRPEAAHRALQDILGSIAELKFWRETIFSSDPVSEAQFTDEQLELICSGLEELTLVTAEQGPVIRRDARNLIDILKKYGSPRVLIEKRPSVARKDFLFILRERLEQAITTELNLSNPGYTERVEQLIRAYKNT